MKTTSDEFNAFCKEHNLDVSTKSVWIVWNMLRKERQLREASEDFCQAVQDQRDEALNKIAVIESKFTSGNSVPVDRITIKSSEWYNV